MIDSVTSTAPTAPVVSTTRKDSGAGSQDYFLKLLVAQMKNQDPLNPLDNAQVTSQLAQLNTVEGINKLATKLDALLGDSAASQSLQAASLVGHVVMAPGTSLALADGEAMGGIELTGAVDKLVVTVKDASGQVVHTGDLGKHAAGLTSFVWDGRTDAGTTATAGQYTFSIEAKSGTAKVVANTLSTGVVERVAPGADGANLYVHGVGSLPMSQVKQIF